MNNPPLQRLGAAVLLQGPVLQQCRALVTKAVREASRRDGIPPSPMTRDLLQALSEACEMQPMSLARQGDTENSRPLEEYEVELGIGSQEASDLLGVSRRQIQRLADAGKLESRRSTNGALVFDRAEVVTYRNRL